MIENPRSIWVKETRPEVLAQGETREAAEESARVSHDEVVAPACPACGQPVSDKEWERHRAEVHGRPRQVVRPWGKPDARECLIVAPTRDLLDEKIQQWRALHPGVRLEPAGEGRDLEHGLLYFRGILRAGRTRIRV
jgi:hypothetical protein